MSIDEKKLLRELVETQQRMVMILEKQNWNFGAMSQSLKRLVELKELQTK